MDSRKSRPRVFLFRAVVLIALLLAPFDCFAAISDPPKSIRVVMDDNYPPYVFKGEQGELKGILVDQWRLWAKQTGIHVEITGLDWAEAQRRMQAGEFDLIDTIFYNEQRAKIYDFTKRYAVIPVPLFFHSDISGISGPEDAQGFMVAVKAGDTVINILREHDITNIVEYPSYVKIIEAARDGQVKVFTVDRPPALYFLNKMGIQDRFRETQPLYNGEFHRAILKGQPALLATVEHGFAAITKDDYAAIDKRWMGASLAGTPYLRYALYFAGIVAFLVLLLLVWLGILKRAVALKTRELATSEARHRTILQTAMNGVFRVDTRGQLVEVNGAYCRMSGYSEQELLTMSLSELEADESAADIAHHIQMIMEQGASRFESRHLRKDGTVFAAEVSVTYQPADGGHLVAFVQEITERKQAEETRNLLISQLEIKNNEMEQVIYIASHDLRSPLITIEGFSGVLGASLDKILSVLDKSKLSAELQERLTPLIENCTESRDFITKNVDKMSLLLVGLSQVTRLGRVEINKEELDMNRLVADVLAEFELQRQEQGVKIEVSDLPSCSGDPLQINQLFANLIGNALKYSASDHSGFIKISGQKEGEFSVYCVEDNGIGIDPEHQKRIFKMFYQLNPVVSGEGLGLNIVQKIIDRHNGRIWLESEAGKGCRFYVSL